MEICGLYTVHKAEKSADGFSYPVHSHSSYEILIVTKGNCGIVIGGTEYDLGKNDAAFIFENETHGLLINGAPFEFFAVQFIPRVCRSAELDSSLSGLLNLCKNKSGAVSTNSGIIHIAHECQGHLMEGRFCISRINAFYSF